MNKVLKGESYHRSVVIGRLSSTSKRRYYAIADGKGKVAKKQRRGEEKGGGKVYT